MPEPLLCTGLIVAGYSAAVALSRPRSAVSAEAEAVRLNASGVVKQIHRSVALFGPKNEAITALLVLADECRLPGWDGYDAEPVSPGAVRLAQEIISSLPDDLPLPSCAVEPDGCVSLDWMPSPYRTLTLSVGESERLAYAWVDGTDRGHGVARLVDGQLPSRILTEIRRFSAHDLALRAA